MTANDPRLTVGAVVQLDPAHHLGNANGFFAGCFMLVTEVKTFGAQGFVAMPRTRGEQPGQAYYRARWEEMEYIGQAAWTIEETEA